MNLHEQIRSIARDWLGEEIGGATIFTVPDLVDMLILRAFTYQYAEDRSTRAIRRARVLLDSPGWIDVDEPAVE